MKPRQIQREMRRRGWELVRVKGDHYHWRHPSHPGTITTPIIGQDQDRRSGARWRGFWRRLDRMERGQTSRPLK